MQILTGVRENFEFLKRVIGKKKVENHWCMVYIALVACIYPNYYNNDAGCFLVLIAIVIIILCMFFPH